MEEFITYCDQNYNEKEAMRREKLIYVEDDINNFEREIQKIELNQMKEEENKSILFLINELDAEYLKMEEEEKSLLSNKKIKEEEFEREESEFKTFKSIINNWFL